MDIGMPELLIILVIIVLLFGVGRIGKVAGELGKGIRAFRDGLNGAEDIKTEPEAGKDEGQKGNSFINVKKQVERGKHLLNLFMPIP